MTDLGLLAQRRRKCSKCGAVMKYLALGEYKCPECGNEEMDDYGKIRNYLDEHGPASATAIEAAIGVRRSVINNYLRKGRLEITDGSPVFIQCERCGKSIKFGRICAACAKNLVSKADDGSSIPIDEIGEEPVPLPKKSDKMFTNRRG